MNTVFLALEDKCLRDQIKAGMRIFPNMRAVPVPISQLVDILRSSETVEAVIMDLDSAQGDNADRLTQARGLRKDLIILGVGQKEQRERLHRLKMQMDMFSFIPLPLDPFDLVRRLGRLSEALKQPAGSA